MTASPVNVRTELVEALRLDLVGPSNNHPFAHELMHEPPSRWYAHSLSKCHSGLSPFSFSIGVVVRPPLTR